MEVGGRGTKYIRTTMEITTRNNTIKGGKKVLKKYIFFEQNKIRERNIQEINGFHIEVLA